MHYTPNTSINAFSSCLNLFFKTSPLRKTHLFSYSFSLKIRIKDRVKHVISGVDILNSLCIVIIYQNHEFLITKRFLHSLNFKILEGEWISRNSRSSSRNRDLRRDHSQLKNCTSLCSH